MSDGPVRVAVLASGGGTNLQALIDRFNAAASDVARVVAVVSDRAGSGALERARAAGIAAEHVIAANRPVDDVAADLLATLERHRTEIVVLAGYLRLVPAAVVQRWAGRMINIHPALLPAFGGPGYYGRRVHEAVLRAGCKVSGATVHLVDEQYDRGRILAQRAVEVADDDTPDTLAARVLEIEHALLPDAVTELARTLRTEDVA